jgi:dTDP-4-amino-4,6-dideoxygalactose transaminase
MTESAHEIPFNRACTTGRELESIAEAIGCAHLAADGPFTANCRAWLEEHLGCPMALLVHSCTAALEVSALLLDVGPGDEVIMPSFTFVTTATAFALRGATPVFIDVRPDTLNLDERLLEDAITARTKAIVPVHYAGVGCAMNRIAEIASASSIAIVEDAAQGICAEYAGRPLGTLGALGAISFHETKNVTSGHGGVLLVNDQRLLERAEILRDKGTNRSMFFRGQIDKYTWMDLGSSFAMSELAAAFLWPQLQNSETVTEQRRELWQTYHAAFGEAEEAGLLRRPILPETCRHNAHMYYLLTPDQMTRDELIAGLEERGINAVFHYIPLHSSPAGVKYGRAHGALPVTEDISARLVRLPLWTGMTIAQIERVTDGVLEIVARAAASRRRSPRRGRPRIPASG